MKKYYLVYRVYSEKERPNIPDKERIVFYGWSTDKVVIKAFLKQRNPKKYQVQKVHEEDVNLHELDQELIIDFVTLKSVNGEEYELFMTQRQLRESEKAIHHYFYDLARLVERDNGNTTLLEMYMNLSQYYLDALTCIGFNPPELESLFPSNDDYGMGVDDLIDSAYESQYSSPQETYKHDNNIPGMSMLEEDSAKIIYSLESFIKVLKDDM